MSKEAEVIELFKQIGKIIHKHGIDNFLNKLRDIQFISDDYNSYVCEYIITVTSNHFVIKKDILLNSSLRGKVSEARRMCFALIKEHLSLSDEQIGNYFGGRSRQYINREINSLRFNREKMNKSEIKFLSDFTELSKMVWIFKYSIKNNVKNNL